MDMSLKITQVDNGFILEWTDEEYIYDGCGSQVEEITPRKEVLQFIEGDEELVEVVAAQDIAQFVVDHFFGSGLGFTVGNAADSQDEDVSCCGDTVQDEGCESLLGACHYAACMPSGSLKVLHAGDVGWSPTYEVVRDLRRAYDRVSEELAELKATTPSCACSHPSRYKQDGDKKE